jgi:hypothetical protein
MREERQRLIRKTEEMQGGRYARNDEDGGRSASSNKVGRRDARHYRIRKQGQELLQRNK